MPAKDALDISGLEGVSEHDMEELLKVNKDEWLSEVASVKEHYAKFGDELPKELHNQLEALEKRLNA